MDADELDRNRNKVHDGLARINSAVATWKGAMTSAIVRDAATPPDNGDAAVELRHSMDALHADLKSVLEKLGTATADAERLEAEAMSAVQRGDDAAARSALLQRVPVAEACEGLEADAQVIRAMLDECATVLGDTVNRPDR